MNFSGLDNTKSYTITLSANRNATGTSGNAVRWSKFTIAGATAFTNASSTGTLNNGGGTPASASQVWFNTGNNSTLGYVAKWTGITPTAGAFSIQTSYIAAPSGTTNTSSYAPSMIKLEQGVAVPTAPGAPTIGTATAGNASAQLTWAAPTSNGGSAINGYAITPYIGAVAQTAQIVGNVSSATVTGLTNGTAYTFKVAASNGVGTGTQSAASNAVTPSASAPTTEWTSFVDLYGTGSGTDAKALTLTPPNGTTCTAPCTPFPTTDTFTLKNFATVPT